MIPMRLWVDDVREAPTGWYWCVSAEDAINFITAYWESIDHISFDHDLGFDLTKYIPSGYDVATHIEKMIQDGHKPNFTVSVHSFNPVGRQNIINCLRACGCVFDNNKPQELVEETD